jgi:hypothetical protein
MAAQLDDGNVIRYSNGITVDRDKNGFPHFSDGTSSWWAAAGWLAFSNGIQIRKTSTDLYRFSTGIACETQLPQLVECKPMPPD